MLVTEWNTASSSFKRFICTLFEQLNSNWHGISIPPHSCLQCRLRPIPSTLISPLRTRKYHAIRENSRGKWPTVSSSSLLSYINAHVNSFCFSRENDTEPCCTRFRFEQRLMSRTFKHCTM